MVLESVGVGDLFQEATVKISQREARRLKRRVALLEQERRDQRNRWATDWPGGVHLGHIAREIDFLTGRIDAAQMLGHAVVVRQEANGRINFYALSLPKA